MSCTTASIGPSSSCALRSRSRRALAHSRGRPTTPSSKWSQPATRLCARRKGSQLKRLAKGEGYGNVFLEDADMPPVTSRSVLVRAHTSLISRGSEILRRYRLQGPVDAAIMGYSLAGTVTAVGDEARAAGFAPGDRVFALSPHAEYVAVDVEPEGLQVRRLPADLPWQRAPFQSLAYGAVAWAEASQASPTDTVVVLGQG